MRGRLLFVVRREDKRVIALLGVSTHLGCRVLWPGDPQFGKGFMLRDVVEFEDPCGGSTFAIDGACNGGPCPRGLDRYPVKVVAGTAEIDLTQLHTGPSRRTTEGSAS